MVGRDVAAWLQEQKPSPRTDEVVLSVEHLTNENYQDVSFELHKGEILGFFRLGRSRKNRGNENNHWSMTREFRKIVLKGKEVKAAGILQSFESRNRFITGR